MSTPLATIIRQQIRHDGPISLARYMAACLGHPEHGYYMTRDPLGARGDFITAPEISQMFGELLGLWCADAWMRIGKPDPAVLVELGPGRGTLMADARRAGRLIPDFIESVATWLVETSPALRRRQTETLGTDGLAWADSLGEVPEAPLFLIANEFFDALPIRQFERTPAGWRERLVDWDDAAGRFRLVAADHADMAEALLPSAAGLASGSVAELCPAAISIVTDIARRVATHGGGALIVDYGYADGETGDTFQALAGHHPVDPLLAPGEADLTAHVDFQRLAQAAREAGAAVLGPWLQADFLSAIGLPQRTRTLIAANPADRAAIEAARDRLTDRAPAGMGRLFKVLGIVHPNLAEPALADGADRA
ncbi:MAG: SAM-dependent methyltransferase [Azospirillaceae bacterium]